MTFYTNEQLEKQILDAIEILDGNEEPVDWREGDHPELLRKLSEHLEAYREQEDIRFEAEDNVARWRPIERAPKDGTFILLAGPSGYGTTPLRVAVGRWYPEYRPLNPWQTHSDDAFTDGGAAPTLWMPLP